MEIQEKINKLIEDYNKQRIMGFDSEAKNFDDLKDNSGLIFYLNENAEFEVVDFVFEKKIISGSALNLYLSFKNIDKKTLKNWYSYHTNNFALNLIVEDKIERIIFNNPVLFEKFKPILAEKRLKSFNQTCH